MNQQSQAISTTNQLLPHGPTITMHQQQISTGMINPLEPTTLSTLLPHMLNIITTNPLQVQLNIMNPLQSAVPAATTVQVYNVLFEKKLKYYDKLNLL